MIYLDNAATTLKKPEEVINAVVQAMNSMGNAGRGAHEGVLQAAMKIYGTRKKLAEFFGCKRADHVVFTCNSTEALNIAIMGTLGAGDHVITTQLEHNSVLRPLYRLKKEKGLQISFLPTDKKGDPCYEALPGCLQKNTRAIISTHASNLTGNVVDAGRLGSFAKEHGLLFILDASQTAGVIPVDMDTLNADIVCFTGHKSMLGPQGTGGMCIREGYEPAPFKVGGTGVMSYLEEQPSEMPTRLEAGTLNGHGIAGLSAAIDYMAGHPERYEVEHALMQRFYEAVSDIDGITVYGNFSAGLRAPIVALNIRDYSSGEVSDVLFQDYGIATRSGAHCAPLMHKALGTMEQGAVRFSFSSFNTMEETEAAIEAVREIAHRG